MRLILTAIILTMLAQPVWAETVYYCFMKNFVSIEDETPAHYQKERFLMAVTEKEVVFKSEGYLTGSVSLNFYDDVDGSFSGVKFDPAHRVISISFRAPNFRLSVVDPNEVLSLHATCDIF